GIIYGCGIYCIYAVNPNGTIRWKWKINDYILTHPAMGRDGTLYVAAWDGYLYAIEPRDAADLRLTGIYHGLTYGCVRVKVKNAGCEPAYNVTCTAVFSFYNWREDKRETKRFTTIVPEIDVNEEIVVDIKGVYLNPFIYNPFDSEISQIKVEAENANHDIMYEGGSFVEAPVIFKLVCVGGFDVWLKYGSGW
ncbi:MAG: hypothetical protein FE042_06540, partial [Thermoplasmata archaeon]